MTDEKTLQEKAETMLKQFEQKIRDADNRKFYCLKDEAENREIYQDICMEAHGDMLPDDYKYDFIVEALEAIAESEEGEEEETIYEIEADCYTSELTAWLNSHNSRVYYLTEALEEFECKDGFQALAIAQQKEKMEVAFSILNSLNKI